MSLKSKIVFILVNALVTVALLFLFYNLNEKGAKQVYIDTSKLLGNYQGMMDAKKAFDEKAKLWQANIDTLGGELENSIKKYEKERLNMPEKEKKLSEELLDHKQQQFMQYKNAMQKKAADEEQNLTKTAIDRVNEYIKEYGKSHNYKIIFGTVSGNILYADEKIDVTQDVLNGLNQMYTAK